jgi:TRAP-type C4-dicarboxylate transport system permease small subunit
MRLYIRIVSALSLAGGVVAMLLLAAAVLVTCQMIFVRYMLGGSTIWQTEFVIYSIVAATFVGSPWVLIERGHVGVDFLPKALHGSSRFYVELAGGLAALLFCLLLAWSGFIYFYEAATRGWRTATVWQLPLWIPLFPLPLGIGLLALQYVAEILKLKEGGTLAQSEASAFEDME